MQTNGSCQFAMRIMRSPRNARRWKRSNKTKEALELLGNCLCSVSHLASCSPQPAPALIQVARSACVNRNVLDGPCKGGTAGKFPLMTCSSNDLIRTLSPPKSLDHAIFANTSGAVFFFCGPPCPMCSVWGPASTSLPVLFDLILHGMSCLGSPQRRGLIK